MVVDAILRATAEGGTTAAISQVVATAAAVAIAGGKIDANLFAPVTGRGCRSSEVAQPDPTTSSGDAMMSGFDGWWWWW